MFFKLDGKSIKKIYVSGPLAPEIHNHLLHDVIDLIFFDKWKKIDLNGDQTAVVGLADQAVLGEPRKVPGIVHHQLKEKQNIN